MDLTSGVYAKLLNRKQRGLQSRSDKPFSVDQGHFTDPSTTTESRPVGQNYYSLRGARIIQEARMAVALLLADFPDL